MSVELGSTKPAPTRTRAGEILRKILGKRLSMARWDAQTNLRYNYCHRDSQRTLDALRGSHDGERCFIIGNGPSLNNTNLALLRDEYTFGLNRINLAFDRLGFRTSCLVCINRLVLEQSGSELGRIEIPKFFSMLGKCYIPKDADVTYLRPTIRPQFSRNPVRHGVWEGATVTYVALQLAYWFGFRQAVLVGVDHSFATKGPAHSIVTADAPDTDHFDPRYFGPGYRWQLPDLETSEIAYGAAREAYEADGREVLDATVGGKLEVYPKVTLEELF